MSDLDKLIQQEKIKHLFNNAIPGMIVTSVVSTVLAFGFNKQLDLYKFIWWTTINLSLIGRTVDYFRWKKFQLSDSKDLLHFRVGITVTAILWASYCIYFYDKSGFYELAISMVVVSGMAGGATTVMAGDKFSINLYTFFLIVPFSLRVILDLNSPYQMIGVLGFAFYFVMAVIGKKTVSYVAESISLRLENENLISSMENEIQQRTDENRELLQRDSLTGLLNRNSFIDKTKNAILASPNSTFAIFFIDLNNFKPINDNLGHLIGDKVLKVITRKINDLCGIDSFVCRWGGDEFVILKQYSNHHDALNLSKSLSKDIGTEFSIDGYQINVGAAIGVSIYPIHSKSIDELISFADMAMYTNKNNKNYQSVVFDFTMSEKVSNDFYLSSAVRDSISKNQLETYFQPIVNSQTGKIEAVEALVRWKLNDKFISPDVFIPLAEKNGFITELGYWVLKDSLNQIKNIDKYGYNLHVCVNVSLAQLQDKNFVLNVANIIHEAGINPNRLHIELTESVFSSDSNFIAEKVKQLQSYGIKISIDDFGTGYSSLSLIQSLHVNIVKIDKSFVSRIHGNGIDVIKAVMVMSKGLGYDIVAEGVETQEQINILTELGIKYLQGYFYSKPVPINDLLKIIETKNLSNLLYYNS